ncbi:hypothetical protein Droror1_Dr00007279 [Drosera rotundifolia]
MGIDEGGGDGVLGERKVLVSGGSGVLGGDETSPDALKNTPSNIAKLEDEIEQCKGRQKYLTQTRSPSDGGDVLWYFCKVPLGVNEFAASIPHKEIVGKGEYFRLGMRDSLAIEASFLQREEELLSYWWREYAECSAGPSGRPSSSTKAGSSQNSEASGLYEVEEERVGVPVKGGLYEVDLLRRHCFPVYWNGENRRVLRGHWFAQSGSLDWLPLREDIAEQLEFAYFRQVWHRRTFQPSGLFAARVDLQGSTAGLHALFTGEDDTWEAWLNTDATGFASVINFGGNGIKLRRGYAASQSSKPTQDELRQQQEEAMDDYCSQVPVRHLVFMVHGIGQRLEKSNLIDDVSNFREITSIMAEKHLTPYQRGVQRVLFIPCQWRKGLKLSGESTVEKITLDGLRGFRTTLSATVHDVLYYMSPIYCQDIIDSVSNQLNRLYLKFLKRNPGYEGKVSVYGHSLGSVLSYDILCHQENLSSAFPMDSMYTDPGRKGEVVHNVYSGSPGIDSNCNGTGFSTTVVNDDKLGDYPVEEGSPPASISTASDVESVGREGFSEDNKTKTVDAAPVFSLIDQEESCDSAPVVVLGNDALHVASGLTEMNLPESYEVYTGENHEEFSRPIDDENEEIKALKAEVDFLKGKLAELDSHSADVDSHVTPDKDAVVLPPVQADPPKTYEHSIRYTKLEFKVDTFFAVGSPLGVFLALRNVRIGAGSGAEYWAEGNIIEELPACQRMFNIFHPFDPVAYRVEPLICKEYLSLRPVIIPYHKGGKRLHIGFQEFSEDLAARSQSIVNKLNTVKVKVLTVCQSKKDSIEDASDDTSEEGRSYGSIMMERLTGSEEGRVDYALQDKTFQHPYLKALGSHTNYWRDFDTALFILKHLYRDIPEEPEPLARQTSSALSDSLLVRSFSWKGKKTNKGSF